MNLDSRDLALTTSVRAILRTESGGSVSSQKKMIFPDNFVGGF